MTTANPTAITIPKNEAEFKTLLLNSLTLVGQVGLHHPWLDDEPVRAYCDIAWISTYITKKEEVFTNICSEIRASIEKNMITLGWSDKYPQDKSDFDAWCKKSDEERKLRISKRDVSISEF